MARRAKSWSKTERRRLLRDLESSGQTVAAFARDLGISAWTIYSWRRQERERRAPREEELPSFVQLKVASSEVPAQPLEVELEDGKRVRVPVGFDEEALRRLLGVLASC